MESITLRRLFRRDSLLTMIKIYVPGVLFLALMGTFSLLNDFHFSDLSRDPVQLLNGKPYLGLVSDVGILMWCSTAAVLFYSSILSFLARKPKNEINFLISSGLLTTLMLADDQFLLHDVIFPQYIHISENVFFVFYGLCVIGLFYFFRKIIVKTDYVLLILSFGFLGFSAFVDFIEALGFESKYSMAYEDILKFMGIVSWIAYFLRTAYQKTRLIIKTDTD